MKTKNEDKYTYAEKHNLNPAQFDDLQLGQKACGFSIRTFRRLGMSGIKTAGDLLRIKESDLKDIRGFGEKCFHEVDNFLQTLEEDPYKENLHPEPLALKQELISHKYEVYNGNFLFAEKNELTGNEKAYLAAMKEGYELLGQDLILEVQNNAASVFILQEMLQNIAGIREERKQLVDAVERIPKDRLQLSAAGFINLFSEDESTRDVLRNIYGADDALLGDILKKLYLPKKEMNLAIRFARWCAFDLNDELQGLFNLIHKKENMRVVLRERSNNHTLEVAGQVLGVTRERVRQIEAKARRIFAGWYNRRKILAQISVLRNGDTVLTPVELQEYFGQDTTEILYLLRTTQGLSYLYDTQLDAYIVEDLDQSERVKKFVDELPDKFTDVRLDSIRKDAEEKGLSIELLMLSIDDEYKKTGNVYHRTRLTVREICELTLKRYYKNGIHAYDEQQLAEFRAHVETDFGDVGLPKLNRALTADIVRVSVLCGRGTYKLDENYLLSKELLDAICRYVDESEKKVFLTNTLFSVFEEELLAEGVDNKYYLQGLLHKQLGSRYVFRRDCVSKDESSTSIYVEVVDYIKRFDHPISKKQIFDEYPGITEIVFSFSVSDPKVISYFHEYIYADNLDFRKEDIEYFQTVLEKMLAKDGYCVAKDVYAYIDAENPISMKRLYIRYQYGLFSILEYLFREKYQFSRPYIAYPGVEILHASERMDELIRNSDEITLAEINEYAREIHFYIYSILDFADEHNDTHLLKNDKELISIEEAGVDQTCAAQIESLILAEISGTMPISALKSIHKFPKISIPWTEWLIYSVIKKWSNKLEVGAESSTSSRQFRHMHPFVALKGHLVVDEVDMTGIDGTILEADDLDHIDDLIEDIILEEIGDL